MRYYCSRFTLRALCLLAMILILSGYRPLHAITFPRATVEIRQTGSYPAEEPAVTGTGASFSSSPDPCRPFENEFEEIGELLKNGRWTDAEVMLLQIKTEAPDCALIPLTQGRIHYYHRNDRMALALFNDLAVRHPEIHQTYHFRGLIYNEQGLPSVALEEFHKVLMVNPTIGSGYFMRYIFPFLEKDGMLLPAHIDSMLLFVTDPAARNLSRGYLAFYLDDYPAALDYFKAVITDKPDHAGAWLYAGRSYESMRWALEAYHCYNKAIDIDNTYARAWLHRGLTKINEGNWFRGCRDLRKAKELEHPAADMAIQNFCRRGRFQ
jgi:tetratricopeptide (TPR) repeat protein